MYICKDTAKPNRAKPNRTKADLPAPRVDETTFSFGRSWLHFCTKVDSVLHRRIDQADKARKTSLKRRAGSV